MIVAMVQNNGNVIVQSHLATRPIEDLLVLPAKRRRKAIAPSAIAIPEREVEVKNDEFRFSQR